LNGFNRGSLINKRGCLTEYWLEFSKCMKFLGSIGLALSLVCLALAICLTIAYNVAKENYRMSVRARSYPIEYEDEEGRYHPHQQQRLALTNNKRYINE
jgi:hypothetical protein